MHTPWWTHDPADLQSTPPGVNGISLPRDPYGSVLWETDKTLDFLKAAEDNPDHYGRHKLAAFMAAHHKNGRVPHRYPRWAHYDDAKTC